MAENEELDDADCVRGYAALQIGKSSLELIQGDITETDCEAIVNPAIAFLVVNIEVWFRFVVIGMWIG